MGFSSGTFTYTTSGLPVTTGTTISSTVENNKNTETATGLTTCILKDGTQTATASIPFAQGITVGGALTINASGVITSAATFNSAVTLGDAAADNITVNGTITSNLIFTDATYDIGASGATRPRDFFLSRNATLGGTLSIGVGAITSGTYTPTLTGVTNVAASTAYLCHYLRVGATVTVAGRVDIDPTAVAATELGISLPVASNFAAVDDCGGTAANGDLAGNSASIFADTTNDRAALFMVPADAANRAFAFHFTYQVI